ncbi:histidine kinase [Clostridioides sp. ZZV15-6598]|uniref:sensor histidine kinase n=1 Tax=Clostridioides sp. ZZV15-6598 TaxID=2811501 RepID=UPI001D128BAE|nr:histidine kinase [Clostridioides sp. ZZV15-6598]
MEKKTSRWYMYYLPVLLTLSVILLLVCAFKSDKHSNPRSNLIPVSFIGEFRTSDSENFHPFINVDSLNNIRKESIYLRGHFSRNIPAGETLLLHISHLKVNIHVSNKEVFSIGQEESENALTKSTGHLWTGFKSDGISVDDLVEITIQRVYPSGRALQLVCFFDEMQIGSKGDLIVSTLHENRIGLIFTMLTISFGLFGLIASIILFCLKSELTRQIFLLSWFAIFGGIWCLADFNILTLIIQSPTLVSILELLSQFLLPTFCILYLATYLTEWRLKVINLGVYSIMIGILFCVILQILHIYDLHEFLILQNSICILIVSLGMGFLVIEIIIYREVDAKIALVAYLPATIGGIAEIANYYTIYIRSLPFFCIGFLTTIVLQIGHMMLSIKRKEKFQQRLEGELMENRISIMLSQIQPHFLYNALNTIQYLCKHDSDMAVHAVEKFSSYLRGNMDSLTQKKLIPFEKELAHLKNYLYIELLRFGERIKIHYELTITDFFIPVLTVQPIVENAIRHGVTKQKEGGTIIVSTSKDENNIYIVIKDDGVGFRPFERANDGKSHIGIQNVKRRLETQCNGNLNIESCIGKGTIVTIIIPIRKE